MTLRQDGAMVVMVAAAAVAGCATAEYRVPGAEVQRLAHLPPPARGQQVRVVPLYAPLWPSTEGQVAPPVTVAPPVVAAVAPMVPPTWPPPALGNDVFLDEDQPPAATLVSPPAIYVDVSIPVGQARPFDGSRRSVPPRVSAPMRAPGPMRGTPTAPAPFAASSHAATTATVAGAGWRGTPVPSAPHVSHSAPHVSRGASHGSGGGDHAVAAAAGVVAIVGLVALLAVASDNAEQLAAEARVFDGWVGVIPTHSLHLFYGNGVTRAVPLSDLRPADAVGVRYAVLCDAEGEVRRGPRIAPPPPVAPPRPAIPVTPPAARPPSPPPLAPPPPPSLSPAPPASRSLSPAPPASPAFPPLSPAPPAPRPVVTPAPPIS